MTETVPPAYLQASGASNAAKLARRSIAPLSFSEGVGSFNGANDLKVSERGAGANMSVDVAKGGAFIQGDDTTDQGMYFVYNDGIVNKAIAAADGTNPRKDIVIAEVNDNQEGQSGDNWAISVVTGTPAGSPAEPALPPSALKLAVIDIPALDTTISNAQITDSRISADPPFAVYDDGVLEATEPSINLTGSGFTVVDDSANKKIVVASSIGLDKSWHYFKQAGTSPLERYYSVAPGYQGKSTLSQGIGQNNEMYLLPFPSVRGGTIDRIAIHVTVSGDASSVARLGIYSNAGDTVQQPETLLLDTGTFPVTSTGVKISIVNFALSPNSMYWIAIRNAGWSVTAPSYEAYDSSDTNSTFLSNAMIGFATASSGPRLGLRLTNMSIGTEFPDPCPTPLTVALNTMPVICVRYSA